jgi:hypothetical protein
MTNELLADGRLRDRGIFEPREVARLWDEHRTGRAEHPHRLWQLVMLELWFRQFIDRTPASAGGYAGADVRKTTDERGRHAAALAWSPAVPNGPAITEAM